MDARELFAGAMQKAADLKAPLRPKRLMAIAASTALAASGVFGVQVWQAQGSQAAARCTDGSRYDAIEFQYGRHQATTRTVESVLWTSASGSANMQLRYNSTFRCAYVVFGTSGYHPDVVVHMDRTTNGGASWDGLLGVEVMPSTLLGGDKGSWTRLGRAFNDNSADPVGTKVRACMNVVGAQFGCTNWF